MGVDFLSNFSEKVDVFYVFPYLVTELDVYDGRHRLLPGPQQGGAEADPQVAGRHQVVRTLTGYLDNNTIQGDNQVHVN